VNAAGFYHADSFRASGNQKGGVVNRTALYAGIASAALAGAVLASTGGAQQQAAPTGTLDVVGLQREAELRFLDNPPRGEERPPSAGDVVTVVQKLRNTSNARIGEARAAFTSTGGRAFNAVGSATFRVGGGTITAEGIVDDRGRRDRSDTLAITGGTGAYEDAGGTLTFTERRGSTRFHFDFSG
jgi:hypothetical protein